MVYENYLNAQNYLDIKLENMYYMYYKYENNYIKYENYYIKNYLGSILEGPFLSHGLW